MKPRIGLVRNGRYFQLRFVDRTGKRCGISFGGPKSDIGRPEAEAVLSSVRARLQPANVELVERLASAVRSAWSGPVDGDVWMRGSWFESVGVAGGISSEALKKAGQDGRVERRLINGRNVYRLESVCAAWPEHRGAIVTKATTEGLLAAGNSGKPRESAGKQRRGGLKSEPPTGR